MQRYGASSLLLVAGPLGSSMRGNGNSRHGNARLQDTVALDTAGGATFASFRCEHVVGRRTVSLVACAPAGIGDARGKARDFDEEGPQGAHRAGDHAHTVFDVGPVQQR